MKLSEIGAQTSQPMKLSQVMGAQAPASPIDGMSTFDKLAAGTGQGMVSANNAIEQFMANNPGVAAALGLPAPGMTDPRIAQAVNANVDESARMDAPLLETTPGMIGSVIGQTVATAPAGFGGKAVQGAGGLAKMLNAARVGAQGGAAAGMATPVENANQDGFNAAKAGQVGGGAAIGGIAGGGLNRGAALLENLLPSNATANVLNLANRGANKTDLAREGEELARLTGVTMTPGQISGSKTMNAAENAARQSIFSREIADVGDQKRVQQLADHFQKTMDGITKSSASPAVAGAQVQSAVKRTIAGLEDVRAKQAFQDYGELRRVTQGSLKLQPDNLRAELSDILAQHGDMGIASSDALATFAKKQMSSSANGGDLDGLLKLRQHLSKVAGGQAKISGDNQDRAIAAKLLRSIDDDLDMNADKMPGDVGALLKKANANYRGMSQQIDSVKASPLGKVLGEDFAGALGSGEFNKIAPEVVMDRMAKLKPTELGVVRGILEKSDPESWAVLKRGLLEDAIEKSSQMPASAGVNNAVLRPSQLVKNVGDQKRLEAAFSPSELSEINAGLNVARRLSDSTGYNFSGTAAQNEALGLMNKITAGGIKGAAHLAGGALGSRKLAKIMTDADGRRMLLEIKRLGPKSQRARELAAKLAAITATDGSGDPNDGS